LNFLYLYDIINYTYEKQFKKGEIMKRFNVTGNCIPEEDYMVDISGKIEQIKKLVDGRYYFTINRARQYGKTTTLYALKRNLTDKYLVAHISFQGTSEHNFASEENFCKFIPCQISKALKMTQADKEYAEKWVNPSIVSLDLLNVHITDMCEDKKVVLMIDEVDNATNNRIFVRFLNMLREKYIARRNGDDYTFHSVILAGVYDIKNIKLKMITEGSYIPTEGETKIYNSPWNIAVNFTIDMSFNPVEISTMLNEYEADHKTGMNIAEISEEIYGYTSGYPFLVSRICQCVDEELSKDWTANGVNEAVHILLEEDNTLFRDIFKNIHNYKELRDFLYDLLFVGKPFSFNIDDPVINLGYMFGFFKNVNRKTWISNKIFEMRIYNYFVLQSEKDSSNNINITGITKYEVLQGGGFDMELCLRRFAQHYGELFSSRDIEFLERHGRLLFLSYLKPLINGEGFYHVESEINDFRMDIVVDYKCEQFIVELKIWRGERYEEMAYKQLAGYLDTKKADKGYLLTFDFRKESNKNRKAEWIEIGGKKIFDVII